MSTTHRTTQASPCQDGYLSSGTSPTPLRIHLLGAGGVGCALLGRWDPRWRLVCVSDRGGSVYRSQGLAPRRVRRAKAAGHSVARLPGGRELPLNAVLDLVEADVLVDVSSTDPHSAEAHRARCLRLAKKGRGIVFAAKDALAHSHPELWASGASLGLNGVLGGTGAALQRELPTLRSAAHSLRCVPNASSTAVLEALAGGRSFAEACEEARSAGLLESDPRLDLDGTDAAIKLSLVAGLLEGRRVDWREIHRPVLPELDPGWVRQVRQRGGCVRLVGHWTRGQTPSLAFEAVAPGSLLASDASSVIYAYQRRDGTRRVHVGHGLGPVGTAAAVAEDLRRLEQEHRA